MERRDNYAIAAAQARQLFLNYDQVKIARKLKAEMDDSYLYSVLFSEKYRIHRTSGDISRYHGGQWVEANSFEESLTLLDLVCDSSETRSPSGVWKNMSEFGLQFHSGLLESKRDPWAERFESNPNAFAKACVAMGGEKYPLGDEAYSIEVFDGLRILVQLWFGDEDFPAQLRWLWDSNAKQYIKYETMYYAVNLLLHRIEEMM